MSDCREDRQAAVAALRDHQAWVLKVVLALNAAMFVVEASAGMLAHSTALLADSLDMLGDTLVYGFSLYVIGRGERWLAISALIKGLIMALFAAFVLLEVVLKLLSPAVPWAEAIGAVGLLAFAVNALCLGLLWRHRGDDLNFRSVWLCSRNDVIANSGVLVAAVGVWATHSFWPDLVVGVVIAGLFVRSAGGVLNGAITQLRKRPA